MSEPWAIVLGAVIGAVFAAGGSYLLQLRESTRHRRETEAGDLRDLAVALTAWYESMVEVAKRPRTAEQLSVDRYPELRVMMMSERVQDDGIRDAADQLMAIEADILLSMDPNTDSAQRQEALSSAMSLYPDLQRRIGTRIRALQK